MSVKKADKLRRSRRVYTKEFRQEAVPMVLDGQSVSSVVERLGISSANLLYPWKNEQLQRMGPVASSLDARVRDFENKLRRVERERDILKKSLGYFQPSRVADVYHAAVAIVRDNDVTSREVCHVCELKRASKNSCVSRTRARP